MAKVIIHKNQNGGVSVTYPTADFLETNTIEDLLTKNSLNDAFIVDESELPLDEDIYFDAWELIDGKVIVSLEKSKEVTKKRLRSEREPLLQAQDVAFQRALEESSDTSLIVAEKQRLRDVTKLADQATSLEELKALKASNE